MLHRTAAALVQATASSGSKVSVPQAWLKDDVAPALLESAADVTDAQVQKHLHLLGLSELLTSNALSDTVEVCSAWVTDLSAWSIKQEQQSPLREADIGIFTNAEVSAAMAAESVGLAGAVPVLKPSADPVPPQLVPAYLRGPVYSCFPRILRPQLMKLPNEYTKLHAQVMSKVAAYRANHPSAAEGKAAGEPKVGEFEHPAICLVCAAVLDAGGRGQCSAHTVACCGEAGIFFLLQVSDVRRNLCSL
jgi:hypothetical protein